MSGEVHTVRLRIGGQVQGVGFRFWTQQEALLRNLRGWVRNLSDGMVEALISGDADDVAGMVEACRKGPPRAEVMTLAEEDAESFSSREGEGFRILRG